MWGIHPTSQSYHYRNTPVFLAFFSPPHSEEVKSLLTAFTSEKGLQASAAAYDQYTAHWGSNPGKNDIKKTVVEIETDYVFLVPTQTSLYLHAKHAKWVNLHH